MRLIDSQTREELTTGKQIEYRGRTCFLSGLDGPKGLVFLYPEDDRGPFPVRAKELGAEFVRE